MSAFIISIKQRIINLEISDFEKRSPIPYTFVHIEHMVPFFLQNCTNTSLCKRQSLRLYNEHYRCLPRMGFESVLKKNHGVYFGKIHFLIHLTSTGSPLMAIALYPKANVKFLLTFLLFVVLSSLMPMSFWTRP